MLASDALHLYANMETTNPFPIVYNVGDMVKGYARLHELADSPAHIIAGHDPRVMAEYPPVSDELVGIAVRLDAAPN